MLQMREQRASIAEATLVPLEFVDVRLNAVHVSDQNERGEDQPREQLIAISHDECERKGRGERCE